MTANWPRNILRAVHLQMEILVYEGQDENIVIEQVDAAGRKASVLIRPENVTSVVRALTAVAEKVGT